MLRNSPDALPSDEALTYWVKLAHIAEDVGFRFSMADPTTSVNITEPQTQYALKGFERQLEDWRKEVPSEVYSRKFTLPCFELNSQPADRLL